MFGEAYSFAVFCTFVNRKVKDLMFVGKKLAHLDKKF